MEVSPVLSPRHSQEKEEISVKVALQNLNLYKKDNVNVDPECDSMREISEIPKKPISHSIFKEIFVQKKDSQYKNSEKDSQSVKTNNTYFSVQRFISNLKQYGLRKPVKFLTKRNHIIINDLSFNYRNWEKYIEKNKEKPNKRLKEVSNKMRTGFLEAFFKKLMVFLSKIEVFETSMVFMIIWNAFSALLTLIYFFIIPLELTFGLRLIREYKVFDDFEVISLALFILDILINCNTAIYVKGQLCKDRREIIRTYFKNEFLIDFFSLASLFFNIYLNNFEGETFEENNWISLFQLFFFLKLIHFPGKIKNIEQILFLEESTHYILSLCKLLIRLMFISHFCACFWYLIGSIEPETSWLADRSLLSSSWHIKYLNSYYFICVTMNTVGYGDITPKNNIEKFFSIIMIYFVCGIFAYNLNSIGIIVKEIAKRESEFEKRLHTMNGYMKQKGIAFESKMRVCKYLEYICNEEKIGKFDEETKILNRLSDSLREELLLQGNGCVLKPLKMFSSNFTEGFLRAMIPLLNEVRFTPGDIIFMRNDSENRDLYIILKGKVEVFFESNKNHDGASILKTLGPGDTFGEIAFFSDEARNSCVRSSDFTTAYKIKKSQFLNLIRKFNFDYQKFCEIKDSINVYQDYSDLFLKCYCCGGSSHVINQCPIVNLRICKEIVIAREQKSFMQKREKRLRHRKKGNSLKSRLLNESNAVFLQNDIQNAVENETFTPGTFRIPKPGTRARENDDFLSYIEEEVKENPTFSKSESKLTVDVSRSNLEAVSKKELNEEIGHNLRKNPIIPNLFLSENNESERSNRNQENLPENGMNENPNKSEMSKSDIIKTENLNKSEGIRNSDNKNATLSLNTQNSKAIGSVKEIGCDAKKSILKKKSSVLMFSEEMDQMKSWNFYFPRNNWENVKGAKGGFRFLRKPDKENKKKEMGNSKKTTKITPAMISGYTFRTSNHHVKHFFLNSKTIENKKRGLRK